MKKKIQAIPYRIVNGRVLYFVGKRPDSTYLQPITGCVGWEIPKETLVEALRRELEEEIGVKHFCNLINPKFSYTFKTARIKFSNGRPVREHVFGVEVSDQKITLDKNEFASFEFVSYDKALAQYSFPNQKHALALVNATISSHSYPKIFTISGPGASGKETIIEEILGKIKNIERAKTCNTRAVRKNEKKPKKGRIF
ncbi:MAG TPA: NUDIX domain-containing protein, partial [Patescibacteria group bacterium]|nr:NUDIX domain-containing protein [Patescibacteria group bacterium]